MGDVFLAQDVILSRNVVLKFLPPHFSADESFKARFMREARTAASLNHPNIITIHEIDDSDGRLYIAMEEVKGDSLKQYMAGGVDDHLAAVDIIVQACSGLQVAHESGIIHRDIKPDNIMLTRGGLVKVLDFGLAKLKGDGDLTRAGTTMGTVNYMSPEQGQGLEVDHRSDIFSIGIVFYELLTGAAAFTKESMPATIYAIMHDELPRLIDRKPHLPVELQPIIDRCLAKNVSDRYQSMADMISELNAIRGQSQVFHSYKTSAPPTVPHVKSLAVLCLTNLGSDDDEFLCYGISEDLIVDLTRIGSLRVAPMRSVLKFRNGDADLAEIARKLDVEFILDGSLMKAGSTVRVSAQLINVSSGKNLWADRWEASADDLPGIKSDLSRGVGFALGVGDEKIIQSQVSSPDIADARAYEFYLRGKYAFDNKKDTSDLEVAAGLYRQALTADPNLIVALIGLAEIAVHKGEYEKAVEHLLPKLEAAQSDGRNVDAFRLLLVIGEAQIHLSHWDNAIETLSKASGIAGDLGDVAGEARALQLLIDVYQQRAQFDEALRLFERIMQITRDLDDQDMAADSLKSIANVHYRKGEYIRAMTLYEEAGAIAQRRGNISLEAKCISNMGLAQAITGSSAASIDSFKSALQMYTQVGDRKGQSNVYNNMALVYSAQGEYGKALEFGQKAADQEMELRETAGYALAICNVARYKAILGDYKAALEMANEALRVALDLDYPFVRNLANDSLGYCCYCSNDLPKALRYFRAALEVAEKSGLRREEALALSNLAEVSYSLNDFERASEFAERALKLASEIGGSIAIIRATIYQAALNDDQAAAVHAGESILQKAREYSDPRLVITCLRILSDICRRDPTNEKLVTDGRVYLDEATIMAKEKGIAHEVRMCNDIRDS